LNVDPLRVDLLSHGTSVDLQAIASSAAVGEGGWGLLPQHKTQFRGVTRVGFAFTLAAAAYHLVRLPKLLAEAG